VNQTTLMRQSFWQKSNDPARRGLPYRLSRFVRARVLDLCRYGTLLADEPRAARALWRGWEASHYVRLLRWREAGYQPQVVYDIGAHRGDWAAMCQAILKPKLCVLFEPQQDYLEAARPLQPSNGASWILLPVALGEAPASAVLHLTQNRAASSLLSPIEGGDLGTQTQVTGQSSVRIAPLDALVQQEKLPPPDLVKIDVQGFESKVIGGGMGTLAKASRMVIEVSLRPIYQGQALLPEILRALCDMGFELEDFNEVCRSWPAGNLWQADLWLKRAE
jgi:FkbM family methyltransferase